MGLFMGLFTCMDYRGLKAVCLGNVYPLPKGNIFSKVDLLPGQN